MIVAYCKKHPKYKAMREPRTREMCYACSIVYYFRKLSNQEEYAHEDLVVEGVDDIKRNNG